MGFDSLRGLRQTSNSFFLPCKPYSKSILRELTTDLFDVIGVANGKAEKILRFGNQIGAAAFSGPSHEMVVDIPNGVSASEELHNL